MTETLGIVGIVFILVSELIWTLISGFCDTELIAPYLYMFGVIVLLLTVASQENFRFGVAYSLGYLIPAGLIFVQRFHHLVPTVFFFSGMIILGDTIRKMDPNDREEYKLGLEELPIVYLAMGASYILLGYISEALLFLIIGIIYGTNIFFAV